MTNSKKVLFVFGTRPEAIKMGPVIKEMQKHPHWFTVKVAVTGQHREQLVQVLEDFQIIPDLNLDLMKENQSIHSFTVEAIKGLETVFLKEKPDLILVHGDTQTAFCAALSAFFQKIPIAHVEAGLRTKNKYSPFPEEINRRLVDTMSDLYFAPTNTNKQNLVKEGIEEASIFVTGQTAIDAALMTFRKDYRFTVPAFQQLDFNKKQVAGVTLHRRENLGSAMNQVFQAIRELADENENVQFVYPVHLNPNVRKPAFAALSGHERILLCDPVSYPDMINLIGRARFLISDSGGLQEEATVFNKPLILTRDTTERPEAVGSRSITLTGTNKALIKEKALEILHSLPETGASASPFGDGLASKRIAEAAAVYLGLAQQLPEPFKAEQHDS